MTSIKAPYKPSLIIGLIITLCVTSLAVISLFYTPYDVEMFSIKNRLQSTTHEHWLGTDHFGRDILSMVMVGARISISVALIAVSIGVIIGVPLGCLSAAKGGVIDNFLMRGNDVIFAFPSLLSAILITAVFGPGAVNAVIAIGIFNIPVFARVARGATLSIWSNSYILAAKACGKNTLQIIAYHVLPNIFGLLLVQLTIQFSLGILAEAGLAYIGLGAQPPLPSWGRMLFEAQTMVSSAPHTAIIPGLAIILTVLGLNLIGDGLRDTLDPKQT